MKNISVKSKILVFCLFLLVFFYFGVIPRILNAEKYQPQIRKILEKSLKNPVTLGHMHTNLTWNLGLKIYVDKLSICHKNQTCFASSGPTSFEISLPYLLVHKVKIRKIYIKNLNLSIKRLKNGHFDIEQVFFGKGKINVVFKNAKITVSDYKIFFVDEFLPHKKYFLIKGQNLKISNFNPAKSIKIVLDGQINSKNKKNTYLNLEYSSNLPLNTKTLLKNNLFLQGKVQNLYPDIYFSYLQSYFPDYSYLSGVVNSHFYINLHKKDFWSDDFKFNIYIRDFIAKKYNKGEVLKALGLLEIDVFAKRKNQKLIIKKLTINSPDIDIKLQGNINKISSKNPVLNLKLFIKNSKIEAISYLFPEEIKVPYDVFKYFRKFKLKSNFLGEVDIKGTVKKLNLFGDLAFKNFSLTRNSKTIPDGKILLNFSGKICNIDADILVNPNEHLFIKGNVIPQLDKISLGIKAHSIQIRPAEELLFAIRDIMKFNLGHFVSNTTIDGKGDSDIYVYGDSSNHYLYGFLKLSDCKLNYSGLSQPFTHVVGKVKFNEDDIYFNNIKAFGIKSPLLINGKVIKNKVDLIFDFKKFNAKEARRLINKSHDLVLTKNIIKNMKDISGYFSGKLIFGSDKNNDFIFKKLTLHIIDGSVTYEEVGFPIRLLKGSVLIIPKETFFKEVQSEIFGVPAKISGQIKAKNGILSQKYIVNFKKFPAEKIHNFEISPLMSKQVKNIFQKFQNTKGYLDADLKFLSKDVFADVRFYDTDFIYAPLNLPIRIRNGRLIITPENMKFDSLNAIVDNSQVHFNGLLKDYKKTPLMDNFILNIPKSTDINLLYHIFSKNPQTVFFDSGSFGGSLKFHGPVSSLSPLGILEFENIVRDNIFVSHALLELDVDGLNLQDSDAEMAGQKFKILATAEKDFSSPFKIKRLEISSAKVDLENIMGSFKNTSKTLNQKTLPIVIQDGALCIGELIFNKFCARNFSSSLSLDKNGVLKLPDFQLVLANGCAKGCVSYNLKNTKFSGGVHARGMSVNSLATLLKLSPDEISGNLSCDAKFCTYGKTQAEIIKNAKASADFRIDGGYYKKLGKAQYLLMAQSTLLSGIGNISINKILNLIFPENLGRFKTFSGTIVANNASLRSNNLSLQSENLNILASGYKDIASKRSEVVAIGQLPDEGNKKFGILGDISPSVFLSFIPGIGFLPDSTRFLGLIGLLPFFDNFHSQALKSDTCAQKPLQKYKKFLVRMLKINNCYKAFGSFEWFDKLSENEKAKFYLKK